jgi:signal transduction histidine kinase
MIARSLRWRLLLGAATAILLALLLAWLFMTLLFERHLERRLQADMTRDALRLVAALSLSPAGVPMVAGSPGDPRFEQPASGYYWQASTPAGAARSRSLWDEALPLPPPAGAPRDGWRLQRARNAAPFAQPVVVLARTLTLGPGAAPVVVVLAQDMRPLVSAQREFGRELAAFLVVLWLVLTAAAWLQVRLGLRPFRAVHADLARLRASASARMPPAGLDELRPLSEAINALADAREGDLEQARRRAADLAHGLKTPLAALAAQSRRAREQGAADAADGMDRAVAAIARTVDAELARARIAAAATGSDAPVSLRPVVERVVDVIERTERGGHLAFDIGVPPALQVMARADDLAEVLGALLENAVRFARRQVRVHGDAGPEWTVLAIEDDGPGIAAEHARDVLARGVRLDESGSGNGLGLAIARELVEAMGGAIDLGVSPLGGLAVRLSWSARRPRA